ncbi:helix-turn-helix domain-containing protein [Erythrobacter rubeus]|uniref:Helix-turn-helix domain-containing protein n=1 Tax=Erythrobacter rubeus TaxID=2760803 RepID=A0ABR8KVW2_9SPHN|nr:helix-turn-helix domain-containing protein [Erythrobacter rubeus]MBD2843530.1 helix-turn-helix domain-containing protein [Erythrobacter rubeus]
MGRKRLTAQSDRLAGFETLPAEPLSVRIPVAVKLTGLSRSRIYEFIESGELETFKIGASTFIPYASLRAFIDSYRTREEGTDPD